MEEDHRFFALSTILHTLLREVGGGGMALAITQWPRASPDLKPPLQVVVSELIPGNGGKFVHPQNPNTWQAQPVDFRKHLSTHSCTFKNECPVVLLNPIDSC